ncbi:alpha-E domain-containing protein [Thiobacillus sp.]
MSHALDRHKWFEVWIGIIRLRQAVAGLLFGIMSRDDGFQFMRLRRNVERADMTSRVLDVSYAAKLPARNAWQPARGLSRSCASTCRCRSATSWRCVCRRRATSKILTGRAITTINGFGRAAA